MQTVKRRNSWNKTSCAHKIQTRHPSRILWPTFLQFPPGRVRPRAACWSVGQDFAPQFHPHLHLPIDAFLSGSDPLPCPDQHPVQWITISHWQCDFSILSNKFQMVLNSNSRPAWIQTFIDKLVFWPVNDKHFTLTLCPRCTTSETLLTLPSLRSWKQTQQQLHNSKAQVCCLSIWFHFPRFTMHTTTYLRYVDQTFPAFSQAF